MNRVTDLEVAKKLIQIEQSASSRGFKFDLSLRTVRRLMNTEKCFFTGVVMNNIENDPNQRTFDRINNRKELVELLKNLGLSLETLSYMKDEELYKTYLERKNKKFFEFPIHLQKYKHLITGVANYPSVEYFLNLPIENNEPQIITLIRTSVESQISLLERLYEDERSEYPNGKTIWLETFYEVVAWIEDQKSADKLSGVIGRTQSDKGSTGFYDLAIDWTNEFEALNKDREWDGEFFDEVEEFCKMKNNE